MLADTLGMPELFVKNCYRFTFRAFLDYPALESALKKCLLALRTSVYLHYLPPLVKETVHKILFLLFFFGELFLDVDQFTVLATEFELVLFKLFAPATFVPDMHHGR